MEAYCNNGSLDHSQAQSDFLDRLKDTQTPIDRKIIELKEAGTKISAVPDTPPDKDEAEIRPPALNLDPLKLGTSGLPFLDDVTLCGWLSSNDILPCLKQSALELSEDVQLRVELEALLATEASQSRETIDFLAHNAPRYFQVIHGVSNLDHPQPTAALFLIKHVRRIKRCTTAHFMHFLLSSRYPRLDEIFYMLSAGAIVTMYKDLYVNQSASFFGRLFDSDLAEPMVIQARQAWDNLLIFSGNESGADSKSSVALVHAAVVASADQSRHGPAFPALGTEMIRDLQDEAISQYEKLQSTFARAMRKNPELMTIIPPETGRIQPQEPKSFDGLVGFPPRKRPGPLVCDQACMTNLNLHTLECCERIYKAKKDSIDDDEGDVPSFTFQMPHVNEASGQNPPGLNRKKWVEPFTAEETLVAFKMFRAVLSIRSADAFDSAFQWTMIAEGLAGRSVADCIRFYATNKAIIDMSIDSLSGRDSPLDIGDECECGSVIKDMSAHAVALRKKEDVYNAKVSKAEAHVEGLEEEYKDLRARNEFLKTNIHQMKTEIQQMKTKNRQRETEKRQLETVKHQLETERTQLAFNLQVLVIRAQEPEDET
jgi:hypothetical protein